MTFSVGLLGHGTVGAAFHELLDDRADAIEATTGQRPEISGVLTRSRGDFDDILERSDLIVELIGGIEPARTYILQALAAGKHVVTANKQVLSQHGEEIYEAARAGGAQLRFEAAVGGVVPVIRVIHETLAAARASGLVDLLAVLREQRLVGGDDVLARMQRAQDVLACGLDAADQLDDQVAALDDVVEVAAAVGEHAHHLGAHAGGGLDRPRPLVDQIVQRRPDRAVAEQPDAK